MSAPRKIPDFTVVARRAFELALHRAPNASPTCAKSSPRCETAALNDAQHLIPALIEGQSFRLAARIAGLSRVAAKRVLEEGAVRCATRQVSLLRAWPRTALTHSGVWAFAVKDRGGRPARVDPLNDASMWMHLWMDEGSGVVALWLIGPSSLATSTAAHDSLTAAATLDVMTRAISGQDTADPSRVPTGHHVLASWLATVDAGPWKKVRGLWLATSLLVAAHNFCLIDGAGSPPAIQAGWTARPWAVEELALVAVSSSLV
jgi:hypothetical protein